VSHAYLITLGESRFLEVLNGKSQLHGGEKIKQQLFVCPIYLRRNASCVSAEENRAGVKYETHKH
jgi:hypothetical protein